MLELSVNIEKYDKSQRWEIVIIFDLDQTWGDPPHLWLNLIYEVLPWKVSGVSERTVMKSHCSSDKIGGVFQSPLTNVAIA